MSASKVVEVQQESRAMPKKYRGVRQRAWGKWVSEIRVPAHVVGATRARIWLGSYHSAPAAAVARDVALLVLHGHTQADAHHHLNFPAHFYPSFTYTLQKSCTTLTSSSVQRIAMAHGAALDRHISSQRQ